MKRKIWFAILVACGLALTLYGGVVAVYRAQAQEGQPGLLAPQANVGTGFTYQGRITQGDSPISGTCSLDFGLYDALTGGAQVGVTQTVAAVPVADGYFSVELNDSQQFGASAFDGTARYLQIKVNNCSGGGGAATLNPRVALTGAPYAHSLRPGASIVQPAATGGTLYAQNGADWSPPLAILFSSAGLWGDSQGGIGVMGNSQYGIGVEGYADSSSGTGVYGSAPSTGTVGIATATSGTNRGVYGKTYATSGHGVYGTSPSTSPVYAGVTGVNTGGGAGSGVYGYSLGGYGVRGLSTVGTGVYGDGLMTGTVGIARASSGASYGVYGQANSSTGYGLYSDGNAHVDGMLSWRTYTSYLSIPAAALQPGDDADNWSLTDAFFESVDDTYYVAPLFLPHNSKLVELKAWCQDSSPSTATVELRRVDPNWGGAQTFAAVETVGSTGDMQVITYTVQGGFEVIDNSQYSYVLYVTLPDDSIRYWQAVIAYTITGPH